MFKNNNLFTIVLLNSIQPLSESLNKFLSSSLKSQHFKKNEILVNEGEVCKYIYVIRKGLIRGFFNYKKKQITNWVSVDGEMVTSISGYFKNEPAQENIQCLEDTYAECISYEDFHFALKNFKEMEALSRIILEKYYLFAEYRAFASRIPSSKGRYEYFIKNNHPEIIKRTPKKYLASLLNMRPETLSRIEKNAVMCV
ncbi:CRP-like cAMP-binding protein [Jejuia pallidilutea]|uniref:CRP-like cAMP-binding protein n=1 Tax=Jejuia pallidilutea TaxID=504487 RepID=A0A362XDG5_9FLAO|nr:Crp/Fnr family transcriptional regulator [Jejuia pallidilutea]PQV49468.1 CRP-like cAMP-binding protein [Jejuia pallidilutea]